MAVFYSQERMGLDGKASPSSSSLDARRRGEDPPAAVWARDDDPRTTPVGRWLRRLDLDERRRCLERPQGDMSIVGPPAEPYVLRRAVQASHQQTCGATK